MDFNELAKLNTRIIRKLESKQEAALPTEATLDSSRTYSRMEFQPVGDQIFCTSARKDGESLARAGSFRAFLKKDG